MQEQERSYGVSLKYQAFLEAAQAKQEQQAILHERRRIEDETLENLRVSRVKAELTQETYVKTLAVNTRLRQPYYRHVQNCSTCVVVEPTQMSETGRSAGTSEPHNTGTLALRSSRKSASSDVSSSPCSLAASEEINRHPTFHFPSFKLSIVKAEDDVTTRWIPLAIPLSLSHHDGQSSTMSIGRNARVCHIVIDSPCVLEQHAELILSTEESSLQVHLVDRSSRIQSAVHRMSMNACEIEPNVPKKLHHKDVIEFQCHVRQFAHHKVTCQVFLPPR